LPYSFPHGRRTEGILSGATRKEEDKQEIKSLGCGKVYVVLHFIHHTAMDPNSQNQNAVGVNPTPTPTPNTQPLTTNSSEPVESKDPIRSSIAKKQTRDSSGKFVSKSDPMKLPPVTVSVNSPKSVNTTNPPDLVNLKITNPLIYIKYWWKRIMANEGIDMRFRVKPLTVFGIALIAFSLAFGLGGVILPTFFPWMKISGIETSPIPTPGQEIWKDTALKGTLSRTNTTPVRYYLVTTSTEATYLEAPDEINLNSLVGRRILAIGTYNSKDKILQVEDIQDLELLPITPLPLPISTVTPTSSPVPVPTSTIEPVFSPTASPTFSSTPSSS